MPKTYSFKIKIALLLVLIGTLGAGLAVSCPRTSYWWKNRKAQERLDRLVPELIRLGLDTGESTSTSSGDLDVVPPHGEELARMLHAKMLAWWQEEDHVKLGMGVEDSRRLLNAPQKFMKCGDHKLTVLHSEEARWYENTEVRLELDATRVIDNGVVTSWVRNVVYRGIDTPEALKRHLIGFLQDHFPQHEAWVRHCRMNEVGKVTRNYFVSDVTHGTEGSIVGVYMDFEAHTLGVVCATGEGGLSCLLESALVRLTNTSSVETEPWSALEKAFQDYLGKNHVDAECEPAY